MARISIDESNRRLEAVREFLLENPDASIRAVNAVVTKKFGQTMRFPRIAAIREQVRLELRGLAPAGPVPEAKLKPAVAHRPATTAVKDAGVALIPGTGAELLALRKAIEALNASGVAELKIDHQTPKYIVVSRA